MRIPCPVWVCRLLPWEIHLEMEKKARHSEMMWKIVKECEREYSRYYKERWKVVGRVFDRRVRVDGEVLE